MRRVRVWFSLVLGLAAAALVGYVAFSDNAPQGTALDTRPAALVNDDCRVCHAAVWDQWALSLHAQAWTSPNVRAEFQHFGHDRKCESCHAPVPMLAAGLGAEVQLRGDDRESGVNCLSCHALADGRIAAARSRSDAPCRPVHAPELLSSQHCAGCHVAIYEDWQQSRYPAEGKSCQGCHMAGDDQAGGRSHRCAGSRDPQFVRSGALMDCRQEGGQLVAAVTNHATGHNFPGERHHRVLLLQVIQRQADGRITSARQETIKAVTPFRGESSAEQIRAGQTFTARFPVVEPPVVADVQLLYKLFPWYSDHEALVVHEQKIALAPP